MDIAPELLEKIEKNFDDRIKNNQALKTLSAKLDKGEWGFLEAEHYALEVGKDLSSALEKYLTVDSLPNGRMYYNIAEKIIPPMMYKEYELATDAAMEVVSLINERAGVRIAPQRPIIDEDRVQGIVDKISDPGDFESVQWLLGDPVQNFAVHCVDKTVETNALFQHRAGLRPRIKRDSGGKCCDWCAALDGIYEYPGVPRDIFMRHENCNCCVEYIPGDGSAQNVYAKTWRDMDAVEERIAFSERAMDNDEARERVLRLGELEKNALQTQSQNAMIRMATEISDVTSPFGQDRFIGMEPLELSQNELRILNELRELSKDGNEHMEVVYADGFLDSFSGDHSSVGFTLKKEHGLANLYHSHTNNSSFSDTDLEKLLLEGVNQIGLITSDGSIFTCSVGNGWVPSAEEFIDAKHAMRIMATENVLAMDKFQEWSYEERAIVARDEQTLLIANAFSWDYRGGKADE